MNELKSASSATQVAIDIRPTLSPAQVRNHAFAVLSRFLYRFAEFESLFNLGKVNKVSSRACIAIFQTGHPLLCPSQNPYLIVVRNVLFPKPVSDPLSFWDLYRIEKVLNPYGRKMGSIWNREFSPRDLVPSREFVKTIQLFHGDLCYKNQELIYEKLRLLLCINPLSQKKFCHNQKIIEELYVEPLKTIRSRQKGVNRARCAFIGLLIIAIGVGIGFGVPLYSSCTPFERGIFICGLSGVGVAVAISILCLFDASSSLRNAQGATRLRFHPADILLPRSDETLNKIAKAVCDCLIAQKTKNAIPYEHLKDREIKGYLAQFLNTSTKKIIKNITIIECIQNIS